ncbi:RND family transporter [Pelagibacterium halotolerans]|uniref:efflux RND transporter permease subunit n=1 Tax=Pelagibacterium halotolerans TaxID=531813 RepID=UPI00384E4116
MSIGFGLERLGLLTLKWPRIAAAIVLAFSALCIFGLFRFEIDSDLLRLYRGTGAEYERYMRLSESFETFENDVYLFVESDDLTDPAVIEELRYLGLELEVNPFAAGTLSPFSLRQPTEDGASVPAVPEGMETRAEVEAALTQLRETDPIMRNLIFADNSGMVMIFFPDPDKLAAEGERAMIASLQDLVSFYETDDISLHLTGPPVWKQELLNAAKGDQWIFMVVGLVLGFITALLSFRTFWGALIATLTPAVSAFWLMGTVTLLFGAFTFLTNIVSVLVLVIAFAESMYFCLYWLRMSQEGIEPRAALQRTVERVSPACALTTLTTIIAFATLTLAPGQGLQEFAISGAIGMCVAFIALATVLPLTLLLALKLGYKLRKPPSVALTAPIPMARRLARVMPRKIAFASVGIAILLLIPHFSLEPRFAFQHFLPSNSESLAISSEIDEGVGGVSPIYVRVPLSGTSATMTDADYERLQTAHRIAERFFGKGKVISAASFDQYTDKGFSREEVFEAIGDFLRARLVSGDGSQALVTGFSPTSENAEQTEALVADLRAGLDAAGLRDAEITGFRVLSAFASTEMIGTLQMSLGLAVVLSIVLIGVAFRSWKMALIAIVPNSLPILFTEFVLYSSGIHLQFTTVISLTIAFGIAVDDTIHFLAHYARARERGETIGGAVDTTLDRVGPALIATTLILVVGCSVLIVSVLPQVAMFGMLSVITLLAALVGDIIVLPAIIIGGSRLFAPRRELSHEEVTSS